MAAAAAGIFDDADRYMNAEQRAHFGELCDFLGNPQHGPDAKMCRSKDTFAWFELWTGPVVKLSEAVHQEFKKDVGFPLNRLEMENFEGNDGTFLRFVMESNVLDDTPDQLPNTVLTMRQESRDYTLVTKGVSFQMNANFLFSPRGREQFAEYCKGMTKAVEQSLAYDVFFEFKRAGIDNFLQHIEAPYPAAEFWRPVQQLVSDTMCFQKHENGHDKLQARIHAQMTAQAMQPTDQISPGGTLLYCNFADPARTQYFKGGAVVYDKESDTDRKALYARNYPSLQLNESRAFRMGMNRGSQDPMFLNIMVGEHYLMSDPVTQQLGLERYRTAFRDIIVGDSHNGRARVTFKSALEACALWANDGSLSDAGGRILRLIQWESRKAIRGLGGSAGGRLHYFGDSKDDNTDTADVDVIGEYDDNKDAAVAGATGITLLGMLDAAGLTGPFLRFLNKPGNLDLANQFLNTLHNRGVKARRGASGGPTPRVGAAHQQFGQGDQKDSVLTGRDRDAVLVGTDAAAPAADVMREDLKVQFTRRAAYSLLQFDLPVPIDIVLKRPYIRLTAGSFLMADLRNKAAVIKENRWMMELIRNSKQRMVGVNLNYAAKTVIERIENFTYVPFVAVSNILGGYGTTLYTSDLAGTEDADPGKRDMYAFAVPYGFQFKAPYSDLTGRVSDAMLARSERGGDLTFPTAEEYNKLWQYGSEEPTNIFAREYYTENHNMNTFTLQGWQKLNVPRDFELGELPHVVYGKGHLGDVVSLSTFQVMRGEAKHMNHAAFEGVAKAL